MFVSKTYSIQDYLYVPKLDGSETIHQISGTTTISDGEMSGGSGYIGAFDNTGNWEITMQCKWGSDSCGIWLIKPTETSRDSNDVLLLKNTIYRHANGGGEGSTTGFSNQCSPNTWYTVKYTKNGNNLTITRNNESKTVTWSLLNTLSTLSIGVDAWGGTSSIKDIVVKPL